MSRVTRLTITFAGVLLLLLAVSACSGSDGSNGTDGTDGTSCTVTDNGDGTITISCEDGTEVTVPAGEDGTSCTVTDNGDGTKTISCDDGTEVTVGDGNDGRPGLGEGETPGLDVIVAVNTPTNGTHFVAGEQIVVTITMADKFGYPITLDDLDTARLYMNGPRDIHKTVTPVDLMNTTADRSASTHHYVNLLTTTEPNLAVDGNELVYTMEPVGSEEAGTYTIGFRGRSAEYADLDRVFELVDVQIGTATVEPLIVGNCTDCHGGASNGINYMHHIEGGSFDIESDPVRTCKMCHNNEGYASVRKCDDGSKAVRISGVYTCADGSEDWSYLNDAIIRRAHGVHNGNKLLTDFNVNPVYGDHHDYLELEFPAKELCTKCHLDDSWKDKPSRLACGTCHDNLDFATGLMDPPNVSDVTCTGNGDCVDVFNGFDGVCNTTSGLCELQAHSGGAHTNDTLCTVCHSGGSFADVERAHTAPVDVYPQELSVTMTAPGNGKYYTPGEAPLVTIVVSQGGTPIDHTTITGSTLSRSYLWVNGPRSKRVPALTTAARAETTTTVAGDWNLAGTTGDLELMIGDVPVTLTPDRSVLTPAAAAAWLNGEAAFSKLAIATEDGSNLTIVVKQSAVNSELTVAATDVSTALGLTAGTYEARARSGSYAANPWYQGYTYSDGTLNDPKATWTTDNVTYQLDDVATAEPGTYILSVRTGASGVPNKWALVEFQIGTDAVDDLIATNCADCHGDVEGRDGFHGNYPFKPDLCASCHDYRRAEPTRQLGDPPDGWGGNAASGRSNFGFGAGPLSRRIHGMHFAHYLEKPEEIHNYNDAAEWAGIIFPQDVRNCVKCHSETDTWMQKPARLPCLGCHDSDSANAHALINTFDPTPVDPYSGDELESCMTCHGEGKDFGVDAVHNIWDPFVRPYPRDPE